MKNLRPTVAAALSGTTLAIGVAAATLGCGLAVSAGQAVAQPAAAVAAPAPAVAPVAAPTKRAAKAEKPARPTTKKSKQPSSSRPSGVDYSKCTNQINYADDPRSNATINSIGEQAGTCPKPLTSSSGDAGGGKGAGYTTTCLDTGTCYDPAGWAPGEGLSDADYHSQKDANGETFYDYCTRTGQPVSTCAAG